MKQPTKSWLHIKANLFLSDVNETGIGIGIIIVIKSLAATESTTAEGKKCLDDFLHFVSGTSSRSEGNTAFPLNFDVGNENWREILISISKMIMKKQSLINVDDQIIRWLFNKMYYWLVIRKTNIVLRHIFGVKCFDNWILEPSFDVPNVWDWVRNTRMLIFFIMFCIGLSPKNKFFCFFSLCHTSRF